MADIAFLLLIFFLVTTEIMEDKGVLVRLPIWSEDEVPPDQFDQEKVLTVGINKHDELLVEGDVVQIGEVTNLVKSHVVNPDFPPQEAIVSLTHDRSSSYAIYLAVYDALIAGYNQLRDEKGQSLYGKDYAQLSKSQQAEIKEMIPLYLSEAEPTDFAEASE